MEKDDTDNSNTLLNHSIAPTFSEQGNDFEKNIENVNEASITNSLDTTYHSNKHHALDNADAKDGQELLCDPESECTENRGMKNFSVHKYKFLQHCIKRSPVSIFYCFIIIISIATSNYSFEGVKFDKSYTSLEPQLEAMREKELSGFNTKVRRNHDTLKDDDGVKETIKESFVCPDCGRQTNSKKQLYRHASQVLTIYQLL